MAGHYVIRGRPATPQERTLTGKNWTEEAVEVKVDEEMRTLGQVAVEFVKAQQEVDDREKALAAVVEGLGQDRNFVGVHFPGTILGIQDIPMTPPLRKAIEDAALEGLFRAQRRSRELAQEVKAAAG